MKNVKKLVLLLTLSLVVAPHPVHAESNKPQIIINPGAQDTPEYVIQEILTENPDAGVIHLIDYDHLPDTSKSLIDKNVEIVSNINDNISLALNPIGFYTTYGKPTTSKTVTVYDEFAKDEFKFSVAKGETVTLSKSYTGSLTGSISGSVFDAAEVGAETTITCTYNKGTQYTGPSESSSYNSREYRMKFYQNSGKYTQTRKVYTHYYGTIIETTTQTVSGTFKKPSKFLSYSIDKKL